MAIFKMFNLYMSPIYETGVVIEPRDTYFTNDIVDWTDLLDTSKDFTIKPQGLLENKELVFTYADNGDDNNRNFKQSTSFNFGYRDLIFDNEFVKETKKVEIPFCLIPLEKDDDDNVMMITKFDGMSMEKSPKPIIAYFGGMKSGRLRYWNFNNTTATDYTTYPFAGHIDDLTAPNYDLAFDVQDFYFYTTPTTSGVTTTDNNLYNQFHKSQWEQIGNKDSKLIEAYFKLRPNDIANLDFRKTYWIKDNAYRLLTVQDYNPNGDSTTLCKLLKFAYQSVFVPTITTANGGNGQGEKDGGYNTTSGVIKKGILATGGNVINDNNVGIVVTGKGNNLGGDNSNVMIAGDNNIILPGITDVMLINSSNLTIAESHVTYFDGIQYSASKKYGAFHDETTQTVAAINTNYEITLSNTDLSSGISLGSPTSRIVFDNSGIYNITFSIQLINESSQIQDANIFLRKNGTNLTQSNSHLSMLEKHGSKNGGAIVTVNFLLSLTANDYIELVWNTTSTNVKIETIPLIVTPSTPATPSVIITIQQI